MDNDDKTQNLASQTEIPVDQAPAIPDINNQESGQNKSLLDKLKNIPIKFLAIGGAIIGLILILTIVGFTLLSGQAAVDTQYTQLSNEINNSLSSGNLDEAERLTDEALSKYEGDPGFIASKISIISARGNKTGTEQANFSEAERYIQTGLELTPNSPTFLRAAGYAYETAGDYNNALELYDKGLSRDPNSSDLHFHRGHVLYFLGRFEEGRQAYQKSIELDSNNASALIALGNIAVIDGELDKAVDLFIKASQNAKTNQLKAEALAATSIVKRKQYKMEESIEYGKQSVAADPEFSTGLGNYGYTLYINGRAQEGAEYINKAIDVNPRISQNYDYAASILRIDGQYEEAISYANQAIQRVSDDNTLFGEEAKIEMRAIYTYGLAKIYSASGGNADTLILLQQSISIKPDLKEALISDYQNGLFQELTGNVQFQALIS